MRICDIVYAINVWHKSDLMLLLIPESPKSITADLYDVKTPVPGKGLYLWMSFLLLLNISHRKHVLLTQYFLDILLGDN